MEKWNEGEQQLTRINLESMDLIGVVLQNNASNKLNYINKGIVMIESNNTLSLLHPFSKQTQVGHRLLKSIRGRQTNL